VRYGRVRIFGGEKLEEEERFDLKSSIQRFGMVYPIIKTRYGILDGFHRKLAGGKEERFIEVPDRITHYALRYHLNEKAKTPEEIQEDKRKCIYEIGLELQRQDPSLRGYELQRKIAEVLGISERTLRRYLPDEFKEEMKGLDEEKAREAREKAGEVKRQQVRGDRIEKRVQPKHDELRVKTRLALEKHYPGESKLLREILRSEKPFLRSKDDINRYWELCRRSKESPFTVFIKNFYAYDGPTGLGYRPALPYWIKKGLEIIASREGEEKSADALATEILSKYITDKGLTKEEIYTGLQKEFKAEWCLE